jgi:O-antigen/teichoic acid export membrane protein
LFQKLKELSRDSAVYGLGDVAVSVVNFLLLPLYVSYLSDVDYGILAQLGSVEVLTKIVARWGLDGAFMRFFYDSPEKADRQRLASSIFFFLLFSNGLLLIGSMAGSRWLASALYSEDGTTALRLVLLNTLVMSFTFLPFHVLRMEKRSVEYSLLTLARSVATVVLRLVLIIGFGLGVLGVVVADLAVTAILMLILSPRFAPLIRPMFSMDVLRQSLRFGLPRVPHAAAQQVIAVADKLILPIFRSIGELGVYSMGVSFGLTLKLFLSAFESAWAPFYYATAREPGAPAVFRTVTTYGVAALVFLAAALSASARDLLDVMTRGRFVESAPVVAWTSLAVLFQGVYLLTSIGLNLTKHTEYYPVSTIAAAACNVGLNFVLIPRHGMIGAAWANAASYALQAALAFRFSQRFYPMQYEYDRLFRVSAAGALAFAAGVSVPDMPAVAAVILRPLTVTVVFGSLLWMSGFFNADELATLARLRRPRGRRPDTPMPAPDATELAGEIISTGLPDDRLDDAPAVAQRPRQ